MLESHRLLSSRPDLSGSTCAHPAGSSTVNVSLAIDDGSRMIQKRSELGELMGTLGIDVTPEGIDLTINETE